MALLVGEPAPWFICRTVSRTRFGLDTIAGRHVVLTFLGSVEDSTGARFLARVHAAGVRFDDANLSFFGVSTDPDDERLGRAVDSIPGIRYFRDHDGAVSRRYGALDADGDYRRISYVLDPALRVLAALPFGVDADEHAAALFEVLDRLSPMPPARPAVPQAPVLVLPRIFEPELCAALVDYYRTHGGEDSGFMRDIEGMTRTVFDHRHKRRRDCIIEDRLLQEACTLRIRQRLVPEVFKAFQFRATRLERCLVACYDASEGGHFRPHRDNTTRGTAHRRFAVSLFLNTGEYAGGFLRFPEYGPALHTAPRGAAVVFSCSILHEATAVTRGRRFMFLPFLYDEAARRIREDNRHFLDTELFGESKAHPEAHEPR
jgi:predicted 2-oxoglutarate/Fe(II)-dependent dioxygenase YbiX/peroxiredoxin